MAKRDERKLHNWVILLFTQFTKNKVRGICNVHRTAEEQSIKCHENKYDRRNYLGCRHVKHNCHQREESFERD